MCIYSPPMCVYCVLGIVLIFRNIVMNEKGFLFFYMSHETMCLLMSRWGSVSLSVAHV